MAALLVLACDSFGNASDLGATLVDPEAQALAVPGTRIASGRYEKLAGNVSKGLGPVVLALNMNADAPRISVSSVSSTCIGREADSFAGHLRSIPFPENGLIALSRTAADGTSTFRFSDYACEDLGIEIPGGKVIHASFPPVDPRGIVVLSSDGSLHYVDEGTREHVAFAEHVEQVAVTKQALWGVSDGVLRSYFAPGAWTEFGSDVTALAVDASDYALYLDGGKLYSTARDEPLAEKACAVRMLGSYAVYYTDCAARQLAVVSWLGGGAQTATFAEGVVDLDRVFVTPEEAVYFLTNTDGNATTGDLWAAGWDGEATLVGERGHITPSGELFLDWDGTKGRRIQPLLDVVESHVTVREVTTLVTDGVPSIGAGILGHFDGRVGDWFDVSGSMLELFAERMPRQSILVRPGEIAFVADADEQGTAGNLLVREMATQGATRSANPTPRVIARGVQVGSAQGMFQPSGYAFLTEPRGGLATLRARLDADQVELAIASGVSEFISDFFPGVVYVLPEGEDAGIWWARPR